MNAYQVAPRIPRPVRNKPSRGVPAQTMMEGIAQLPIDTHQLGNLPLYPERQFISNPEIHVETGNMATMPWYPHPVGNGQQQQQQQPPPFEPPLAAFFDANNPGNYNPPAAPSFSLGGFQSEGPAQPGFVDMTRGFPNNEQNNPPWGVTLNMWSMAPTGFE